MLQVNLSKQLLRVLSSSIEFSPESSPSPYLYYNALTTPATSGEVNKHNSKQVKEMLKIENTTSMLEMWEPDFQTIDENLKMTLDNCFSLLTYDLIHT